MDRARKAHLRTDFHISHASESPRRRRRLPKYIHAAMPDGTPRLKETKASTLTAAFGTNHVMQFSWYEIIHVISMGHLQNQEIVNRKPSFKEPLDIVTKIDLGTKNSD